MAKFLDAAGVEALWARIKAADGVVAELANTKAKIATGSYTGTGTYNTNNKNSLTFDFEPKVVLVSGKHHNYNLTAVLVSGASKVSAIDGSANTDLTLTWNGVTVSWYSSSAAGQFNLSNQNYNWVAIG